MKTVILLLVAFAAFSARAGDVIKVDTAKELGLSHIERLGIGHDLYYDTLDVVARGEGFDHALQRMGVHFIRYGAGDIFWSKPPFTKPEPTLAHTGKADWPAMDRKLIADDRRTFLKRPADFDEAMALFKRINAEPILIVPYDCIHMPDKDERHPPSRADVVAAAAAWVRYANVDKKYNVKYWEIGNEPYLYQYYGYINAEKYAEDLVEMSNAMKAVDPTILVGAVGPTNKNATGKRDEEEGKKNSWWQTVLSKAGKHIDWLSIHDYPCWKWGSYNYFAEHEPDFHGSLKSVHEALKEWAPPRPDGHTIPIIITETNSADWDINVTKDRGWPHENSLGHGLVLFDILEAYTTDPHCTAALIWNTRWAHHVDKPEIFDALDANNELTPTGEVLAIWNKLGGTRVAAQSSHPLKTVAVVKDGKLTLAVLNRGLEVRSARLEVDKPSLSGTVKTWTSPNVNDAKPAWSKAEKISVREGSAEISVPAHSLQMIEFE